MIYFVGMEIPVHLVIPPSFGILPGRKSIQLFLDSFLFARIKMGKRNRLDGYEWY
jgi:hypothetical protein